MYENEELKNIILEAIGNHQSLDHKLHLMEAIVKVFDKVERYEKALKEIEENCAGSAPEKGIHGGTTTIMNTLDVGTKFYVHNGVWNGEIVLNNGVKSILFEGDILRNARPIDDDSTLDITIK